MTIHLTPEILEAAYNYLKTTPPFRRWKLPASDLIEFEVTGSVRFSAEHQRKSKHRHTISLSCRKIGHTLTIFVAMAHEMVHLFQAIKHGRSVGHNEEFHRCARTICRHHGFDPKDF